MSYLKVKNGKKAKIIQGVNWQNSRIADLTLTRLYYLSLSLCKKYKVRTREADVPTTFLKAFILAMALYHICDIFEAIYLALPAHRL